MTNDQLEALVTAQLVAGAIKYGEDSRVSNYVLDHSRNTARDIMAPLRDAAAKDSPSDDAELGRLVRELGEIGRAHV